MADGLNDARAMRIAEVLSDYQAIQTQLAGFRSYLEQCKQGTPGFAILNQVLNEGAALLAVPFANSSSISVPTSPGEGTKKQLQSILLDAASRRFRAMRLYERGVAAVRWIQRRNQYLQGRQPAGTDAVALSKIDNALRQDILAVTDQKVYQTLNSKDTSAGNWTGEMPSLSTISQFIRTQQN